MGEMADMALEHLFDIAEYNELNDDPDGDPDNYVGPSRSGPLIKTCKFCGETGLVWGKMWDPHAKKNNWRLSKDGIIHICKKYKNKRGDI